MLRFLKTTALTGMPFGMGMGVFYAFLMGPLLGAALGLASGVLFGILLAAFVEWQRTRLTGQSPCREGERLLRQGLANHYRGWEGAGGWLYLTDQRLVFRSHGFNGVY